MAAELGKAPGHDLARNLMADTDTSPSPALRPHAPLTPLAPYPPGPGEGTGAYDEDDEDDDDGYGVDHLSAVIRPVAITMVLSSLAVAYVRDPTQDTAVSSGLSMYLVYNEGGSGGGSSTGDMIGQAIVNAVVIVCVIAAATFVLVACYYFRCLKLMVAYLIFACINLLGYRWGGPPRISCLLLADRTVLFRVCKPISL